MKPDKREMVLYYVAASCQKSCTKLIKLFQVQAYDADEGINAEITYTITDTEYGNSRELPISIDPKSGWVYTSGQLDREQQEKYQLQVSFSFYNALTLKGKSLLLYGMAVTPCDLWTCCFTFGIEYLRDIHRQMVGAFSYMKLVFAWSLEIQFFLNSAATKDFRILGILL